MLSAEKDMHVERPQTEAADVLYDEVQQSRHMTHKKRRQLT